MAMANRRAVSGSAVRGRAALSAAALGEGSKGLEPRSKKGGEAANEKVITAWSCRSSGESHGRRRRTGALASRFVSGRKIRISYEKNCCGRNRSRTKFAQALAPSADYIFYVIVYPCFRK